MLAEAILEARNQPEFWLFFDNFEYVWDSQLYGPESPDYGQECDVHVKWS